jgi:hypothetical protein
MSSMKFIVNAAAFVLAATSMSVAPAMAQSDLPADLRNPRIKIEYVTPKDPVFLPLQERLKKRQVLERLQVLLGALKLEKDLTIKTDECGAPLVPYKSGGPVLICYEYIDQIGSLVNARLGNGTVGRVGPIRVTREHAIVGPVVHIVLFNVAHALFDIFDTPIWGNIDDAADTVAAFTMLQFGDDVTVKTLFGTAWFLFETKDTQPMNMFDVRPFLIQRFYNHLCHAYGSDPQLYEPLVSSKVLPKDRANFCPQYYQKYRDSYLELILEGKVDWDKLERVRQIEWLKDD